MENINKPPSFSESLERLNSFVGGFEPMVKLAFVTGAISCGRITNYEELLLEAKNLGLPAEAVREIVRITQFGELLEVCSDGSYTATSSLAEYDDFRQDLQYVHRLEKQVK